MVINWRERFVAAFVHFVVTLVLAGLAAALIFFVWFPNGAAGLVGGTSLFVLVLGTDLVLGPLMSLVIYTKDKARRLLVMDYAIVGVVQIAALLYGIFIVASSRPAFVAFDQDRLEIVAAVEISEQQLQAAKSESFRSLPWWGPKLVAIERLTDPTSLSDISFYDALETPLAHLPKFYIEFDTIRDRVIASALPIERLMQGSGEFQTAIESAVDASQISRGDLRWLPVHHRFGRGIAFINPSTGRPDRYLSIDPSWVKEAPKT